jgi:hypothetical protein
MVRLSEQPLVPTVGGTVGGGANMRAAFWKYAHSRYQAREPHAAIDRAAFLCGTFWLMVYGGALLRGWRPSSSIEVVLGVFLVFAPLALGAVHLRIRLERRKGPNALYQKYLACLLERSDQR